MGENPLIRQPDPFHPPLRHNLLPQKAGFFFAITCEMVGWVAGFRTSTTQPSGAGFTQSITVKSGKLAIQLNESARGLGADQNPFIMDLAGHVLMPDFDFGGNDLECMARYG